jgi:hypothetical protein
MTHAMQNQLFAVYRVVIYKRENLFDNPLGRIYES